MNLKDGYITANCCRPDLSDEIVGYYSHNNIIKIHQTSCPNLKKTDPSRLMNLNWNDVIASEDITPDDDYHDLDPVDFLILQHHRQYGVDYSLKVASMLRLARQIVFDRHRKLRDMKLLKRVRPVMIQYRKNIAKNKWIKHRNHTYYELTEKGTTYLNYYQTNK